MVEFFWSEKMGPDGHFKIYFHFLHSGSAFVFYFWIWLVNFPLLKFPTTTWYTIYYESFEAEKFCNKLYTQTFVNKLSRNHAKTAKLVCLKTSMVLYNANCSWWKTFAVSTSCWNSWVTFTVVSFMQYLTSFMKLLVDNFRSSQLIRESFPPWTMCIIWYEH